LSQINSSLLVTQEFAMKTRIVVSVSLFLEVFEAIRGYLR